MFTSQVKCIFYCIFLQKNSLLFNEEYVILSQSVEANTHFESLVTVIHMDEMQANIAHKWFSVVMLNFSIRRKFLISFK